MKQMKSPWTPAPARVLPPWSPVQVEHIESTTTLGVWGRQYRFDAAALPTSIITAGREVLAAPVRLAGRVDGQHIEWRPGGTIVYEQADHAAVIVGHQCSQRLILNTAVRVEYDGLMQLDITLVPEGGPGDAVRLALDELTLEIPLRPEAATLFHYWPQWFSGTGLDLSAKNSGAVPDAGLALPFKPFIWLGWEEGGLSWFAESDRNWRPADAARAVEVVSDATAVVLRLNLLGGGTPHWAGQEGSWRHQLMPLTFRMGLQATPVKPIPGDLHKWRILQHSNHHTIGEKHNPGFLSKMADAGVRTIVLHESEHPIQNDGFTNEPDELRRVVDACHAQGIRVIVYFGYELSTLSPRWADEADEVLVKDPDGVPAGGWRRAPDQRELIACGNSSYQDTLVNDIIAFIDKFNIDGLYLDQASVPFGCANEAHGCGYTAVDGSRHITFPILAVRNLMKRLYEAVVSRGGIIDVHQSSGCVTPTLAFAHSYYDGEHLIWDKKYETDPVGTIGLETFRAEFMGTNFGVPCQYYCLNSAAWAFPLIHGITPRPSHEIPPALTRLWDVMDAFGVSQAEWWPYWRNEAVLSAGPEDIKASAWVRRTDAGAAEMLIVAANLSPSARHDAEITLRLSATDAANGRLSARDAMTDEPITSTGGRICFPLDPLETRLVRLQVGGSG